MDNPNSPTQDAKKDTPPADVEVPARPHKTADTPPPVDPETEAYYRGDYYDEGLNDAEPPAEPPADVADEPSATSADAPAPSPYSPVPSTRPPAARASDAPPAAADADDKGGEMTLWEHLEELRGTIFKSMGVLLLTTVLAGVFFMQLNDALLWPLNSAIGDRPDRAEFLRMHTPFGVFSVILEIALVGGFMLALPFMLYFFAQFIAPGLTRREKRILAPTCFAALGLFLLGAAFAYFFVLPKGLATALAVNEHMGFFMQPNVQDYYSLLIWMLAGVGAVFEFPLVLLVLMYLEIVPPAALKKYRRYVIVLIFIVAAVVTPPDLISQIVLGVPMCLMYEATIWVGERLLRRKAKKRPAAA